MHMKANSRSGVYDVVGAVFNALVVQISRDDSLFLNTRSLSGSLKTLSIATLFLMYHNKQTCKGAGF